MLPLVARQRLPSKSDMDANEAAALSDLDGIYTLKSGPRHMYMCNHVSMTITPDWFT